MRSILMLFSAVLVLGCGLKVKKGVAVEVYWIKAHSYTTTTFVSTGRSLIPIVSTNYVPDRYYVLVDGLTCAGDSVHCKSVCISKDWWDTVDVGDTLYFECAD